MARTYLDAFLQVRDIKKVQVFSPNKANLLAYVKEMEAQHGIEVVPMDSARAAVKGADIVSCCTSTNEPVFQTDWLEPGMHVTNLTSSEFEPSLIDVIDVGMRAGEATPRLERLPAHADYARAGFLGYIAGNDDERRRVPRLPLAPQVIHLPTLVDHISGKHPGRTSDRQTTFFLNVGAIGAQFEAVAAAVYNKVLAAKLGHQIPEEYFLQDVRD
jgi:alanine dehydrogenase